ncbi:MAG: fumarylacetoacetate hydrolase family protein [Saprospiraceae bacterium]|jgi:2-keto-4-pentenoate hydratase/2-oxohepta-3-ene-1,7-dioic acid hydratase in catechol pathway|nr:fumarylacetoacetate hydrolase family protein [Saprospiraceae bacterium]
MKLIRHGKPSQEKPGIQIPNGTRLDVSAFGQDFDEKFLENDGLSKLADWLKTNQSACPIVSPTTRLGAPIGRPSKIICVGLNYSDHAKESGMTLPTEPILFFKSTTAICGPDDNVIIPKNSEKTDWEVELAVVIGKKASYVDEADAMDCVAGYVLHNDISERAFQLERQGQWVKGKSADTFAPLGPFLVTKDEVADPHNLGIWLKLNGELLQNSNTSNLVFNIPHLVSYISQFMTLLPGDVISTGTPAGVGLGLNPQRYLVPGDVMELGIDSLGVQRQVAVAY